jgi:hypothetical protein
LNEEYFNGREISTVKQQLGHYLSLDIAEIQNTVFQWQSPYELNRIFGNAENLWRENLKSRIADTGKNNIVMDFGDGFAWVNLDRNYCRQEGDAMGHCGNGGNPQEGETILSLRKKEAVDGKNYWTPFATFILDSMGRLGEMKGRGNQKPAERYHKYIVPLLQTDFIKGIKGGGYMPENNFMLSDLPDDQAKKLGEEKPALLSIGDRLRIYGPKSIVEELNTELENDGFTFEAHDDSIWLHVDEHTSLFDKAMDNREIGGNYFGIAITGSRIDRLIKHRPASLVGDLLYEHRFFNIKNLIYELTGEDADEEMFRLLLPENVWNRVAKHMLTYKFMRVAFNDAHQYFAAIEEPSLFPDDLPISYDSYIKGAGLINRSSRPTKPGLHVTLNDFRKFTVNIINAGVYSFYGATLADYLNDRLSPDDDNTSLALMLYNGENAGNVMRISDHGFDVKIGPDEATTLFNSGDFVASLNDNWSAIGFEKGWNFDTLDKDVTDDMYRLLKKVDEQGKPLADDEGYELDYTELGNTIIKIFDTLVNSNADTMKDIRKIHGDIK